MAQIPETNKGFKARLTTAFRSKSKDSSTTRKDSLKDLPASSASSISTATTKASAPPAQSAPRAPPVPPAPPAPRKRLTKAPPQNGRIVKQNGQNIIYGKNGIPRRVDVNGEDIDDQTGERRDYTSMLHGLINEDLMDAPMIRKHYNNEDDDTPKYGHLLVAKLPRKIWAGVLKSLELSDMASLALSCKTFHYLLGTTSWTALNDPRSYYQRINLLNRLDRSYPNHLLCFACATYHPRVNPGEESLKPTNILNPVYLCPKISDQDHKPPRTRLTPGRTLPFTFAQLVTRFHNFGPSYGVSYESLSRRWKDPNSGWSHTSRYHIHNDHLLMRITSQTFAAPGLPPSGQRYLLYSREDFTPYFSVCSHWQDGLMMPICKCALSHIPLPEHTDGFEGVKNKLANQYLRPKKSIRVNLCGRCQPMRRCPECPTEYLVEIKIVEDKSEPDPLKMFKQALVVTRWSDLGDGSTPWSSKEWAAVNDLRNSRSTDSSADIAESAGRVTGVDAEVIPPVSSVVEEYNSFAALGKRAISGIFESFFSPDTLPGQRILSLNPEGVRLGEKGHTWY